MRRHGAYSYDMPVYGFIMRHTRCDDMMLQEACHLRAPYMMRSIYASCLNALIECVGRGGVLCFECGADERHTLISRRALRGESDYT